VGRLANAVAAVVGGFEIDPGGGCADQVMFEEERARLNGGSTRSSASP
jgi:hypothetical protein